MSIAMIRNLAKGEVKDNSYDLLTTPMADWTFTKWADGGITSWNASWSYTNNQAIITVQNNHSGNYAYGDLRSPAIDLSGYKYLIISTNFTKSVDNDGYSPQGTAGLYIIGADSTAATLLTLQPDYPETVIDISNINQSAKIRMVLSGGYHGGTFALYKCVLTNKIPQDGKNPINLLSYSQSDCVYHLTRANTSTTSYGGSFTMNGTTAALYTANNHSSPNLAYSRVKFPYVDTSKYKYLIVNSSKTTSGHNNNSSWVIRLIDNNGNTIRNVSVGSRQIVDIEEVTDIAHILLAVNQDYNTSTLTITELKFTNDST